ncbi:MAG TPA: SIMPL domain-containing protein [Pyrinomonadaceae bacterium]
MKRQILILTSLLALLACMSAQALAAEMTVRGRLARTVEAGGWLVQNSAQKYLILNSRRFQNEQWFKDGAEVEATGEEQRGAATIYQEGVPFEAREMRPAAGGAAAGAVAQVSSLQPTRVLVTGDAIVQAQPDTAIIVLAVVTQGKTALEAQQQNATLSDAVVRAVKSAAGAGAEVKTSGYNLQPQRVYKENQPPTISGYEARNQVTVTMSDLKRVGSVIDTATQAGANNVDNLSFTLRQDRPSRNQALTEATREAISKAQVIAQALGGRVERIIEVQEASATVRPVYQSERAFDSLTAKSAAQTPVEVGTLDIRAQVQVVVEVATLK